MQRKRRDINDGRRRYMVRKRFTMWEVEGVEVRICWGIKWSGRYMGVMKG